MNKSPVPAKMNNSFVADTIEELRKVSWPSRKETVKLTTIVIVISLIIGSYIGIIDVLLSRALEMLAK